MPSPVHVLHDPAGPVCDVLFFHGLQLGSYETAWDHTWRNEQDVLWPAEWLPKDFNARVLSISYDSQAIRGAQTVDQIAKKLVSEVLFLGKVGQDRPVVLVGHSLGGLVLKSLAVEAHKEAGLEGSAFNACCRAFCNHLAGTFFYATPHGGAALGGLADTVFGAVRQKGPVLDFLTVFSKQGAELNRDFMLAFPTQLFMALVETKKYKEYLGNALQRFQDNKHKAMAIQDEVLKRVNSRLADVEISFTEKFTAHVDPSMEWLRGKKKELEQQLGQLWAQGLYSPDLSEKDIRDTEQHRKVTRDFWRNMQTLAKRGELDDSFFTRNWVRRGREYRLLWEPVEIANYYRLNLQKESGHYIDGLSSEIDDNNKRPGRFILLQKQEQRMFGSDPGYGMQSSLGLARLLKERVGNRSWVEYMQQPDGPDA